jgi:hypothetical protein
MFSNAELDRTIVLLNESQTANAVISTYDKMLDSLKTQPEIIGFHVVPSR